MTGTPSHELHGLLTEQSNAASRAIDCLDAVQIARLMNAEDATVATAVATQVEQIGLAIEGIVARMELGGRLVYIGAGTSGRLGVLDASECPPTFSIDPSRVVGWLAGGTRALTHATERLEDDAQAGADAIVELAIGPLDAVVGLTASGRTPYVLGAVDAARQQGALTIGVACNAPSLLHERVDIMIAPVTGPEVIAGSTRLKAGTAQKMVLNMLSTGTMIQLGKTFGNLMVDVKASNAKLRDRAVRIVQEATGLPRQDAARALDAASGETKTAIVAVLAGLPADEARARIAAASGSVRVALGSLAPCP
jgi:N-acetylmuramic acid 6-phosphate etherase